MRTHASEKDRSQEDRVRGKGWGTVSKGKRSDDVPWTSRVTKRRPCLFSGIARTSARRINSIRRDITSFDRPIDRIPLFTFSSSSQASSGFRSDDAGQSNGRRSKLRRARLRTLVEKDVRRDEPTKFGVDHEIGMVPIRACFGSKMAKGEKKSYSNRIGRIRRFSPARDGPTSDTFQPNSQPLPRPLPTPTTKKKNKTKYLFLRNPFRTVRSFSRSILSFEEGKIPLPSTHSSIRPLSLPIDRGTQTERMGS